MARAIDDKYSILRHYKFGTSYCCVLILSFNFASAVQVVGYSWQDSHITFPGNPGFGFSVAWVRVRVSSRISHSFDRSL